MPGCREGFYVPLQVTPIHGGPTSVGIECPPHGGCHETLFMLDQTPRGAVLSLDGIYRYRLWRDLRSRMPQDEARPPPPPSERLAFVMLNPSTADALLDDATIRRCMRFALDLGYLWLDVVNLFALRSTDPNALTTSDGRDLIGPENDKWIRLVCKSAGRVVFAWGSHKSAGFAFHDPNLGAAQPRGQRVMGMLYEKLGIQPYVLRLTKDGYPHHPLRLPANLKLQRFES